MTSGIVHPVAEVPLRATSSGGDGIEAGDDQERLSGTASR